MVMIRMLTSLELFLVHRREIVPMGVVGHIWGLSWSYVGGGGGGVHTQASTWSNRVCVVIRRDLLLRRICRTKGSWLVASSLYPPKLAEARDIIIVIFSRDSAIKKSSA